MDRRVVKVLTSTGAAVNQNLGFVPHKVVTRNLTKWGSTSEVIRCGYSAAMDDASYLSEANQASLTDGILTALETTNGFTPYDTTVRAERQKIISGATAANPCVITMTSHGFTAAANDGDTLAINLMGSDSMVELNGNRYTMTYVNANSVSIDVDSTNFTAYSSTLNAGIGMNTTTASDDTGYKGITIGTGPMANSSDLIEVTAEWFDSYEEV